MDELEFKRRVAAVKHRMHGRWSSLLEQLGVPGTILNQKNQPCPACGGEDRFQFTDKFGEGNYHCRGCGAGDGFKLLQLVLGWPFGVALREVETVIGAVGPSHQLRHEPSSERMKKLAKRIWDEATPVTAENEAGRYLASRGLEMTHYPRVLRCHAKLGFYSRQAGSKSKLVAHHAALLAAIQGPDGHAVSLHRTYLADGAKACGRESKKVLSGGIHGAAVRLFEPGAELAIAEGIETALAVHLCTGKAVWAALSAGNLERIWIPPAVKRVCIYADNDASGSFAGQAAAFALAKRLKQQPSGTPVVEVFVPKQAGEDWADVWLQKRRRQVA